jgi:hypothetical protein
VKVACSGCNAVFQFKEGCLWPKVPSGTSIAAFKKLATSFVPMR